MGQFFGQFKILPLFIGSEIENYTILPLLFGQKRIKLHIFTPFYWVRFGVNQKMRLKGDFQTWKASFLGKESPNLDGQEIRNFVAQDS